MDITIGTKVCKISRRPFKSKNKINTVLNFSVHPITKNKTITFEEDDSYVEIRMCKEVE